MLRMFVTLASVLPLAPQEDNAGILLLVLIGVIILVLWAATKVKR